MLRRVTNMNTGKGLWFQARTPLEAMNKLKYYLSVKDKSAERCTINKTETNLHLYLDYKDERYCIRM